MIVNDIQVGCGRTGPFFRRLGVGEDSGGEFVLDPVLDQDLGLLGKDLARGPKTRSTATTMFPSPSCSRAEPDGVGLAA